MNKQENKENPNKPQNLIFFQLKLFFQLFTVGSHLCYVCQQFLLARCRS